MHVLFFQVRSSGIFLSNAGLSPLRDLSELDTWAQTVCGGGDALIHSANSSLASIFESSDEDDANWIGSVGSPAAARLFQSQAGRLSTSPED